MEIPQKLIIELPYGSAILLGIFPKKTKTLIWKDTCTPIFIAVLFITANIWKQSKCPLVDDYIKKTCYLYMYTHVCVYTHIHIHTVKYYSAIKYEILPFATTWMDLKGIMLNEISQTEKDQYWWLHLYVDSKKQNKWTDNKRKSDS